MRNSLFTGSDYGMTFQVFIDQENYMLNTLSKKAGLVLVIHSPSMTPTANEYGIDLEPNTANSISLQQVRLRMSYIHGSRVEVIVKNIT